MKLVSTQESSLLKLEEKHNATWGQTENSKLPIFESNAKR